jgi:hypothetical protein
MPTTERYSIPKPSVSTPYLDTKRDVAPGFQRFHHLTSCKNRAMASIFLLKLTFFNECQDACRREVVPAHPAGVPLGVQHSVRGERPYAAKIIDRFVLTHTETGKHCTFCCRISDDFRRRPARLQPDRESTMSTRTAVARSQTQAVSIVCRAPYPWARPCMFLVFSRSGRSMTIWSPCAPWYWTHISSCRRLETAYSDQSGRLVEASKNGTSGWAVQQEETWTNRWTDGVIAIASRRLNRPLICTLIVALVMPSGPSGWSAGG